MVGRSRDMAIAFYEDVLPLRLSDDGMLKPIAPGVGWIGDLETKTFFAPPGEGPPAVPTAWLPTERVAKMWQAMLTERPWER